MWGLFSFINVDFIDDKSFEWIIGTPVDKPVRARLGVYYYEQERALIQRSATGPLPVFGLSPGTLPTDPRNEGIENAAVFGGLSWDLATNWQLNLEARYAEDKKTIDSGQRTGSDNSSSPQSAQLDFSNFTPRVTLNWQVTDDILVYGLVAKGNKPGGFNNEFFRSDVPAEYTNFLLNCSIGDTLRLIQPNGPPLTYECTQQFKDDVFFAEEEQWTPAKAAVDEPQRHQVEHNHRAHNGAYGASRTKQLHGPLEIAGHEQHAQKVDVAPP